MLRNNSQTADPITIGGKDIEEVTEFTYLGAKVTTDGNSESEIKARIRKARGAFAALKNIWKTNKISNRTKIDPPVQEQRPECATICGRIMEGHQRHMPDAGSFPKQVSQEDTANLLAKQNLQHGTP